MIDVTALTDQELDELRIACSEEFSRRQGPSELYDPKLQAIILEWLETHSKHTVEE